MAGSDDGCVYIWDRQTGLLVCTMQSDADVVNCVLPHPTQPILATSGIEPHVRLWSPKAIDYSPGELPTELALNGAMQANSDPWHLRARVEANSVEQVRTLNDLVRHCDTPHHSTHVSRQC